MVFQRVDSLILLCGSYGIEKNHSMSSLIIFNSVESDGELNCRQPEQSTRFFTS